MMTRLRSDSASGDSLAMRYGNGTFTNLVARTAELTGLGNVSSFGEDPRGEVYICSLSGGAIFRIAARDGGPCQDLGFGRVGSNGQTPLFEVLGRLEAGVSADLSLRRAPANVPVALVISSSNTPTPIFGGTLVPMPPELIVTLGTDAAGMASLTVAGGLGPAVLYAQWVVADFGLPEAVGFSNACRITFP